jgi:hypothetical protein
MINNALRLVLIAANALLFVLVAYLFSTKTAGSTDFWFGIGLFIYFGLHFGYLLMNPPGGASHGTSNWRIFRLVGLWLDAKESELRQRADQSRQGK